MQTVANMRRVRLGNEAAKTILNSNPIQATSYFWMSKQACPNISQELNIAYHRIKLTFQDKHTEDTESITDLAFKPGKA